MEIEISSPELSAFAARAKAAGNGTAQVLEREFVVKATSIYKQNIVDNTPHKTGKLEKSITGRTSGLTGKVQASAPYAIYVEKGTPAHDIYPKSAQALYWEGAKHPVKHVYHPGTKATHFFENGVYKSLPEIGALMHELLSKLTQVLK